MADKMMRVAGRGNDGNAKAIKTRDDGILEAGIAGSKKLLYRELDFLVNGESYSTLWVRKELHSNYIEVAVVANELNREVMISPVFGLSESNFKDVLNSYGDYTFYLRGTSSKRELVFVTKTLGDYLPSIRFTSLDGNDIKVDVHIWETYSPPTDRVGSYDFKQFIADESMKSHTFDVNAIQFIANDGTDDIVVGLNESSATNKQIILKPGEVLNNIPMSIQKIFLRAKSGEQPVRVMGVR